MSPCADWEMTQIRACFLHTHLSPPPSQTSLAHTPIPPNCHLLRAFWCRASLSTTMPEDACQWLQLLDEIVIVTVTCMHHVPCLSARRVLALWLPLMLRASPVLMVCFHVGFTLFALASVRCVHVLCKIVHTHQTNQENGAIVTPND